MGFNQNEWNSVETVEMEFCWERRNKSGGCDRNLYMNEFYQDDQFLDISFFS